MDSIDCPDFRKGVCFGIAHAQDPDSKHPVDRRVPGCVLSTGLRIIVRPLRRDTNKVENMKEIVSMPGRITVENSDQMRRRLADALRARSALVAVDLSDVPYMDTSGLATLMEAMRTARQQGTRLVLSGIQQQPRYLLKVTEIGRAHV